MGRIRIFIVGLLVGYGVCACTPAREPSADAQLASAIKEPLTPEETEALLSEVGENWLYGQGLGEAAATVGTIAVFPPYALWVAGNAIASVSGYEPLNFSDALPEEEGQAWRETYDAITSAPGQASAAIAGEEFRSKEIAKQRIKKLLDEREAKGGATSQPRPRNGVR